MTEIGLVEMFEQIWEDLLKKMPKPRCGFCGSEKVKIGGEWRCVDCMEIRRL